MDWAATLSAISTAIGLAKQLKEIDTGYDSAVWKANAADLYGKLADVKMALTDARDESREKDDEITRLKSAFAVRGTLVEHQGYKYQPKADGTPRGMPFCPRCEQNLCRYYRLVPSARNVPRDNSECPECKSQYRWVEPFDWE